MPIILLIIICIIGFIIWFSINYIKYSMKELENDEDLTRNDDYNPKFHRTSEEKNLSYQFSDKYGDKIDKFEERWYEQLELANDTNDKTKKLKYYNKALSIYDNAKEFAYSNGEGGEIYFDDMYEHCHNSKNPCFSLRDGLVENIEELV